MNEMEQQQSQPWDTPQFRQGIVRKIEDVLRQSNLQNNTKANPQGLENHIYSKARSKEEYLGLAQKLLLHFKDIPKRHQMHVQKQQEMAANNNMVQDPINALQNLASQGTRNPVPGPVTQNQMQQGPMAGGPNIAASNLLQTLNQQRPGQQQPQNQPQQMQQMRSQQIMNISQNQMAGMNNMNMMGQQQPQQTAQMNQMAAGAGMNQMPMNQMNMNQMGMNQMPMNQMMGRMGNNANMNVVPNSMANQMQMQQNIGGMSNQVQGGAGMIPNAGMVPQSGGPNSMQQMMNIQQKAQPNMVGIPQQGANMYRVGPTPGQNFLPQSPSQNVPSPAQQIPNQSAQLPNAQMIPSPALVPSSSPQMPMIGGNQRVLMQSPSQPLNTPGQPVSSPFNAQEDMIYREKYKQLTKYIEPLKKMLAKLDNDDDQKTLKMSKLLEILRNPHQRIPLETLLKCEKVLERMDLNCEGGTANKHYFLETVSTVLQTPTGHHTLYRTFHPSYDSLFGSDIKLGSPPVKQRRQSVEETQETPHVLQGEIARLDQKFKVTLDPSTQNQNKTLKLNCCLDDKCLPWVPPICVTIPENYPYTSPTCTLNKHEYTSTPFLLSVEKSLTSRIGKLPKLHSLSHILDTWEMSVRQACSPNSSTLTADEILSDILAF